MLVLSMVFQVLTYAQNTTSTITGTTTDADDILPGAIVRLTETGTGTTYTTVSTKKGNSASTAFVPAVPTAWK